MNESELRAALHDGEGDGPDPDSALAAARTGASARRTRIASITGAVVGVVAVGTTGAILLGRGGDAHPKDTAGGPPTVVATKAAASDPSSAYAPIAPLPTGTPTPSGTNGAQPVGPHSGARSAAGCPSAYPEAMTPGGGGTGQFGATDPLFAKPVASVLVCGYGSTGTSSAPDTATLTGTEAQALVASLENAATRRPTGMCSDLRVADDQRYAVVGVTTSGDRLPAVTTTIGNPACTVRVTNGTAIRYAWSPPVALSSRLRAVQPK